MEIPLQAQVECSDGVCGRSVFVLINPIVHQVTHLVVKDTAGPQTEYMVPVEDVAETLADTIRLRCSQSELRQMEPFVQTEYIEERVPDYAGYQGGIYGMGPTYYRPYVTPEITVQVPRDSLQIPPGELAIRRGTRVEATDGYVGQVDEFVVNPENSRITHLVLREGHLWGKKNVIIPLAALGETRRDTVYLKLDKQHLGALPAFPVHRSWA